MGAIYDDVVTAAHDGAIVLQHFGGGPRYQTFAALPQEIDTLRSEGYRFVTVAEMLGSASSIAEPAAHRIDVMSELPERVRIREVGPRDGFQNEPEVIPTADKLRLIEMLGRTGLRAARGDELRPARRDPAAGRRRAGARAVQLAGERLGQRADPERAGARARARAPRSLPGGQRLSVLVGDPQPQERRPLDRGVARWAEADVRPRSRGRAALRGRDLDLVRLPVRGSRSARASAGDRARAGRGGLRGDRLRRHHRDGQPGPGSRVLRGRVRDRSQESS